MTETQDSTSSLTGKQRAARGQKRPQRRLKPSILIAIAGLAVLVGALSLVGSGSRSIAAGLGGDLTDSAPQSGPQQEMWGDVDCSGSVNPIDSLKLLRKDAGLSSLSIQGLCPGLGSTVAVDAVERVWGDGDCSGALNPVDSLKTLRFDAGLSAPKVDPACPDFGSLVTVGATAGQTLLNEVLFVPGVGEDPYVELKATGDGADPSGLLLVNERDDEFVIPGVGEIAGESVLLFEVGSTFLDETTGSLELRDGSEVLDRVAWGAGEADPVRLSTGGVWDDPEPGLTIGRAPDSTAIGPSGWHPFGPGDATPGLPNLQPAVDALLPFDGAIFSTGAVALSWYPVAGAESYQVQVADNDAFSPTLIDETVATPGLDAALEAGDYFWRVRANGASGDSSFSSPQQFSLNPAFVAAAPASAPVTVAVSHLKQRKDTAMLQLEAASKTGNHAWDRAHPDLDVNDPADNMNCVLASLAMMNHSSGGNLSQDRIGYEIFRGRTIGPEYDLNWGDGLGLAEIVDAFSFALGVAPTEFDASTKSTDQEWAFVTAALDAGDPLLSVTSTHATVITGYRSFIGKKFIRIHDPWLGVLWADLALQNFTHLWQASAATNPPDDEAGISADSDNDGIIDFDETQRFHTNANEQDTDQDDVPDKEEVRESVFHASGYLINKFLGGVRDWDGDGLPNERDCDSDNDGLDDGDDPDDWTIPPSPSVPTMCGPPASITIVGHTIERREDHVCKATFELCTYIVTVSVQYTTSVPAAIYCFQVVDGGAASWGNDTNVPSGPGALTVTNDLHSSPPDGPFPIPITCDLRDISSGIPLAPIIATASVPLDVTVPPLPD